jgi:hypothetical protein
MGGKQTPPLQERLAQLTIVLHQLRFDAALDVRKGPDTELSRLAVQSLLKDVEKLVVGLKVDDGAANDVELLAR